jgi:hypothetical protein
MAVQSQAAVCALALCVLGPGASFTQAQALPGDHVSAAASSQPADEADSGEAADDDSGPSASAKQQWRIELKRQSTARGTPSESTKTNLKIEMLPDGPVRLLRLELPFPDEKTSFEGSPFNPRLGDIKTRLGFKAVRLLGTPWTTFIELTFPTADPETLGSGKYQVTLGTETSRPLISIDTASSTHRWFLAALIEQVVSVAGDPDTKNINYTKFELGVGDVWRQDYSGKLTVKPVIDWEQDAKTGAVAELEGAINVSSNWRVTLMLGGQLWGTGVPSTYSKRVELKIRYSFWYSARGRAVTWNGRRDRRSAHARFIAACCL